MQIGRWQFCAPRFKRRPNSEPSFGGNHQKAESKTHAQSMEKLQNELNEMKKTYGALKKHREALKAGKANKEPRV